jgi:hypothetical protein
MPALRHTRKLARHVLVWFVLSLGLSLAQPLLAQPSVELVCSSGGVMKMVTHDTDQTAAHHHQDCSVCMSAGLPPAISLGAPVVPFAPCPLPLAFYISRAAADAAPPLPARGPPALICV